MNCLCGNELTRQQRKFCSIECQKDEARRLRLEKTFAITVAEYDAILAEQDGRCAVCKKFPASGKRLVVDHSHRSTFVRGLLCGYCNLRIIAKHHDPTLLYAAAEYLTNPPARRALGRDVVAPGRPPKKRKPRGVRRPTKGKR